jgi:hypothetical protein
MALVGGVAPLVVTAAVYLWAMSAGADAPDRRGRLAAVARWATLRALLWHAGCAVVVAAAVARAAGGDAAFGRVGGWLVACSGVLTLAGPLARRVRRAPAGTLEP